jgi:peptidoglycan-associated lipoprotein
MKLNQIVFPLVLALAATLATTGCKKGTPKTTIIPGSRQPVIGDSRDPNTLPPSMPFNSDSNPPGINGNGQRPTASLDEFEGMIKDPSAFAANTIRFSFDSAVVKKSEQANIATIAAALAANPSNKLLVEGNCDERGTEEYNRALGERRALAAREALVKAGVNPDRIRTISYGKDKPADPAHDDAAWAKNRRDDFILLLPKTGV